MKKILIGVVVLIVGVIVAGVVVLKSTDINQYRGMIAEEAKKATGRDLKLGGELELEVSFSPAIVAREISLSNAKWGSRPEMVKVKRFEAQVELFPLLTGTISLAKLIIIEPDILLETNKEGVGNWVFDPGAKKEEAKKKDEGGGAGTIPVVKLIDIQNAKFTYKDGVTGKTTALGLDNLKASADSLSSPLNLALKGTFNGNAVEVSGAFGSAEDIMDGNPLPVSITAKAGGGVFTVKGKIEKPMEGKDITLALTADGQNIADVAAVAGAKLHAIGPYKVTASVSDPKGGYALNNLNVKVGSSDLTGNVAVSLAGKKPIINASLKSTLMDIADFLPKSEEGDKAKAPEEKAEPAKKGQKVFPADPLPLDALKSVNATIAYKATKFIAKPMGINDMSVDLSLQNGRLAVSPLNAGLGGGLLKTDIILDGSKATPSLSVKVNGKSLGLGKLLKESGSSDLMNGGDMDIAINLSGNGKSVAKLMAGLNGGAEIKVGEGKINNSAIDWAGADVFSQLNPFGSKEPFTIMKCGIVKAGIKKGMVTIDKGIAFETSKMNVIGDGEVNLAKETLDVSVNTSAKGGVGIGAGDLAKLVKLQGTLAEPSVGLDLLNTVAAGAKIGTALATGGVSLLVGALTDKVTTDQEPCMTALGLKSEQKSSTSAPAKNEAPKKEEPANPISGITSGLKNLFGN
ncbi:MAG: AsmA family protein [Rhodospirillales bacterium]|nr:AsmA family protein [Rhodospirillales bacterium]